MRTADIAIVGAGASGIMAALMAEQYNKSVLLIERNDRVGKKLLATGNGKCNFSHQNISKEDYYGTLAEAFDTWFDQYGVQDVLSFFASAGMVWKDKNGYLYPYSEQAATVLDTLRYRLMAGSVQLLTETCIDSVIAEEVKNGYRFRLFMGRQPVAQCKKLILATGGMAAPTTGSDGLGYKLAGQLHIPYIKPVPALTKFVCTDTFCKELAGVRSEATVSLFRGEEKVAEEKGEVQFTDYGLSGIPIFQISRIVSADLPNSRQEYTCHVDFFPQYKAEQLEELLGKKMEACIRGGLTVEAFLSGLMHKKVAGLLGKKLNLHYQDPVNTALQKKLHALAALCKELTFHIKDVKGFDQAQVTAGGIGLSEVTLQLESRTVEGLYFAGELLDMDGKCGGYNLQWAWTSGAIAGRAAAERL